MIKNNMKKVMVLVLCVMFSLVSVSAGELLTKIDFEISGFSGIDSLNNSDGTSVVISIFNSSGVVVSRNAVRGVYLENMTITMSGAKFNLSYSTAYTYNLSTIYGDFLYNFTTPASLGTSILNTFNDSKSSFTDMGDYVYDSNYGLDWQDGDSGDTLNWTNAMAYCESLDLGGKAVGSWRLPNLGEIVTLIDWGAGGADSNYFPAVFSDTTNKYMWTSTSLPSDDGLAYSIVLDYGLVYNDYKASDYSYYARCVSEH
jgi:hypothetical protein